MGLEPSPPTSHHKQPPPASASHQQLQINNNYKPYVIYSPVDKNNNGPVCNMFNSWSNKAETTARNIWNNLRTGPSSVTESAWGKLNLSAKAMSEGGFESLYKHLFGTEVNEKLKKTYSCSISTTTGPVLGTLYLSTHRLCFCSDTPLATKAPSGPETLSYYKVILPLGNIAKVNLSVLKKTPPEQYIQITTNDGHDFWFMGFGKFEKASHHLLISLSEFKANKNNNPQYIVFSTNSY